MARYAPLALLPGDVEPAPAATTRRSVQPRPGIFRRLYRAMLLARQRDAERAVASYLAGTGGKFTDNVEREIERRLF